MPSLCGPRPPFVWGRWVVAVYRWAGLLHLFWFPLRISLLLCFLWWLVQLFGLSWLSWLRFPPSLLRVFLFSLVRWGLFYASISGALDFFVTSLCGLAVASVLRKASALLGAATASGAVSMVVGAATATAATAAMTARRRLIFQAPAGVIARLSWRSLLFAPSVFWIAYEDEFPALPVAPAAVLFSLCASW